MCLLERGLPPACRARNHLCDTNSWGCSQSVQGGKKRRAVSVAVAPFRARGRVQLPQVEHITRITDPSLARHAASCSLGALPAAQVARSAGFRAPVASTQPRLFFEKKRILGLTSPMDQRHDEAPRPRQDHRCHVADAEDLPVHYLDAGPVTGGRSALPPLTAGAMCVSRKMWRIALEDGGAMMTNKGLNPMCVWFPNGDTFVVAPEETLRLCDGCSFGVTGQPSGRTSTCLGELCSRSGPTDSMRLNTHRRLADPRTRHDPTNVGAARGESRLNELAASAALRETAMKDV